MKSERSRRGGSAKRTHHERRVLLMSLGAGLPGVFISLLLLWGGNYSPKVRWTLTIFIVGTWLAVSFALRSRVVRPLQTISNLLAAVREGDYSIRARGAKGADSLAEVMREVNALGETLRTQRIGAVEATALLRAVIAEIDVAIFAFDPHEQLRLINRAGERLLADHMERLIGRTATELGLIDCLQPSVEDAPHTLNRSFSGAQPNQRTWGVRRSTFRERGMPHQLLVISDLSQPLREEERRAWQRIVRVIGHELNNSLAPIKSIAGSLTTLLTREPRPNDWGEDMQRGLHVVSSRAESLSRFMESYARLAKLPPPRQEPLDVAALIRRVAVLETRLRVEIVNGDGLAATVRADVDQLEQLWINLMRNAADAALATAGGVRVGWRTDVDYMDIWVEDDGMGLASSANLFVPFFTTKPGGTGIGLVLSRQIAEAHGGTLSLENKSHGGGCIARLRLPL
ncbi:MAG: ATP-binding protein [Pyrinomonadaceae bacterium]